MSQQYGFRFLRVIDVPGWKAYTPRDLVDCSDCPTCHVSMTVIATLIGNQRINIGCCSLCGLVGYIHRMSDASLREFYRSEWMGESVQVATEHARRMKGIITAKAHYGIDVTEPVLEVACGYGNQIASLQLAGYQDIEAIEACPVRAEAVRNVFGIRVFDGDFISADINRKYRFIVSHHALEHVANPDAFVRRCSELQRPGGRLILSMPDFYEEPSCGVLFFAPHLYSFSIMALDTLLRKHGYVIDGIATNGLFVSAEYRGGVGPMCISTINTVDSAIFKLVQNLSLYNVVGGELTWLKHYDITSLHPSWQKHAHCNPEYRRRIAIEPIDKFRTDSPIEIQYDGDVVLFNK